MISDYLPAYIPLKMLSRCVSDCFSSAPVELVTNNNKVKEMNGKSSNRSIFMYGEYLQFVLCIKKNNIVKFEHSKSISSHASKRFRFTNRG